MALTDNCGVRVVGRTKQNPTEGQRLLEPMTRLPADNEARLYTLPEAAAALDRAEVTLRRWIQKGLLSFVQINGRYYIERNVLRAFVDSHRHPERPRPR
jgi:hypothetical protein